MNQPMPDIAIMHGSILTFSRVLYGPEVTDETSEWAPIWWRKALNECTWPEVISIVWVVDVFAITCLPD